MILPDTSIWIEFFKNNKDFFYLLERLIEERKVFVLECIFGELLQGCRSDKERSIVKGYWGNLPKVNEEGIWISAGTMSSESKLHSKGVGLIDLAILAAARKHKLKVWTLDKKLAKVLNLSERFES